MRGWRLIAEERIRQAIEAGEFNDLAGKGQPLKLREYPFGDPEWRLAFHALSSSGYTLLWVETRREIESELANARRSLHRCWNWCCVHQTREGENEAVTAIWNQAVQKFRQRVVALNQRIRDYNLTVPSDKFQCRLIDVAEELRLITASGEG